MLQGLKLVIKKGYIPTMVEKDSNILIQMAKKLSNGRTMEKFLSSWLLDNRLYILCNLVMAHPMVFFHHVIRDSNKVEDMLENV